MPNELTAEELVELYNNPNSAPLSGRFVGPEQRYVQAPYVMPSREEVAKAVETARNYQYTQDIPGVDTEFNPLPHERVLGAYFGGDIKESGAKEGMEAAMLFNTGRIYEPALDPVDPYYGSALPYRTQGYVQDLSPALQARIRREQETVRDAAELDPEVNGPDSYRAFRMKRTAPLREAALKELEAMYPGLTATKSVITGGASRTIIPPSDYSSDAAMKQEVINQITRLTTGHIRGFESGDPQFYTQRPGYAGETFLDDARRTLNYFRKMYPEDAQSARLLGRYINQVEAKYPMMQGATEYPTRADLPKE